jgi:hypothetical protein
MDRFADPYVVAAMLTYFYTLDYASEGPQMSFGLPTGHITKRDDGDGFGEAVLPAYKEEEDSPETDSGSEFDLVPDMKVAIEGLVDISEGAKNDDEDWDSLTARKTPSPCLCSDTEPIPSTTPTERDPAKPISPIALHVLMYKAALRFEIPCLTLHALRKLEDMISCDIFHGDEVIEAASEAYEDSDLDVDYHQSMSLIRTKILGVVKGRWENIRLRDGFDELVLRRPGFARDILRVI